MIKDETLNVIASVDCLCCHTTTILPVVFMMAVTSLTVRTGPGLSAAPADWRSPSAAAPCSLLSPAAD